jgi:signal-transduction protein with cAMP-binding, CBS, and nucleotidyltransferase domain
MSVLASSTNCSDALLTAVLNQAPLFSGVGQTPWASVNRSFRTRFFRDGEIICREDDAADALLIIWRGGVEISREGIYLITRVLRQ